MFSRCTAIATRQTTDDSAAQSLKRADREQRKGRTAGGFDDAAQRNLVLARQAQDAERIVVENLRQLRNVPVARRCCILVLVFVLVVAFAAVFIGFVVLSVIAASSSARRDTRGRSLLALELRAAVAEAASSGAVAAARADALALRDAGFGQNCTRHSSNKRESRSDARWTLQDDLSHRFGRLGSRKLLEGVDDRLNAAPIQNMDEQDNERANEPGAGRAANPARTNK